jgi:hypothetical protein
MRRSYITPEFHNNYINGSYNMDENSTFFGSKMLEIEDNILVGEDDIIWYENSIGEQLNLSIESSTQALFFSPSDDKLLNHSIYMDKSKSKSRSDSKWFIDIKIEKILMNFLYANLKKYRTFEGIKNNRTIFDSVDDSINAYIISNVLDRYKFDRIDLFLRHRRIDNSISLKLNNTWNPNVKDVYNKFESSLNGIGNELKITFNQLDSDKYSFEYYFNIRFKKI